jgi:exodeoxyribonuclease V alpha subunit
LKPDPPKTARPSEQLGFETATKSTSVKDSETLQGSVTRVTFTNPENGWTVLRLETREAVGPMERVVVGRLPGVREGESLKLWGRWIDNPKYGRQFEAARFVTISPKTEHGILKYLASGLVPGIGPSLAQRLVEAFGAETLEVIERQPRRLTEVEGIGPKRSRTIQETFKEEKALREAMVFLQGHGLNIGQAHRVFKRYGEATVGLVKENPYRLVWEVSGVGFLTADRMAIELGVGEHAPQRVQAALVHELDSATEEGHCFLPEEELVARSVEKLGVDEGTVGAALQTILKMGLVKAETEVGATGYGDNPLIYPSELLADEKWAADNLHRLLTAGGTPLTVDLPKAYAWLKRRLGFELADGQKAALQTAVRSKVILITGGPGTGKTTLVRAILEVLQAKGFRVALCAPTGRASRRLKELTGQDAKTIHRLLEYMPRAARFQRDRNRPLEEDAVIVDELSMVDVSLAASLFQAVGGGCRLILVGDADQLPSVGPGSVLSDIVASGAVPVVRLTEVFRQASESQIVVAAHRVNRGRGLDLDAGAGDGAGRGELFFVERDDPERVADLIGQLVSERIPNRYGMDPLSDVQVLCPMKRGVLGTEQLNARLRELLNPAGRTGSSPVQRFRPGDKVMQIRNNYDKEVFNGDIGLVSAYRADEHKLVVLFDQRPVPYERGEHDELMLAYACTVHKSQGSEYPAVVVPMHTQHYVMLQRNLLYTAITRARRLCVLAGTRKALKIAIANDRLQKRFTRLGWRMRRAGGGRHDG